MTVDKVQVRRFKFKGTETIEIPAHWIPFQVTKVESEGGSMMPADKIEIWAYRNGNG